MLLRILIYALIFGAIYWGIRSIIKDWKGRFKQMDEERHQRDLRERHRPDVIDLKRDDDGVYRPGEKGGDDEGKPG